MITLMRKLDDGTYKLSPASDPAHCNSDEDRWVIPEGATPFRARVRVGNDIVTATLHEFRYKEYRMVYWDQTGDD